MLCKQADLADIAEQEALIRRVNDLMLSTGFRPFRDDPEAFAHTLRRVFGALAWSAAMCARCTS